MDETDYATASLRAALQDFAHELYFKSRHFTRLNRCYTRAAMDRDSVRFAEDTALRLGGDLDPFSSHLRSVLATLPPPASDTELARILDVWERAETTLNCRVKLIFGCLGSEGTSALITELLPGLGNLPPLTLQTGRRPIGTKRSDGRLGQPDIILRHPSMFLSIEMKVRGGSASAKYDAQQHFKYLRLGAEIRSSALEQRIQTAHMLLAPLSGGGVVSRAKSWLNRSAIDGSALACLPGGFLARLPEKRRAQAAELGGVQWIESAQRAMPMHALDLERFVGFATSHAQGTSAESVELRRQLAAVRKYGLATPPTTARC